MNKVCKTILIFLCVFGVLKELKAQCPTQGLPTTTVKGKFEININGNKTLIDGVTTAPKIQVCTNSLFTVNDKSGLTNIRYYFGIRQTAFPTLTLFQSATANRTFQAPATPGQYVVIQISYFAIAPNVRAVLCQPIEVIAPPSNPKFSLSSCATRQAQINIPTDPINTFDTYTINWGDGSPNETITKAQIPLTGKLHNYTNTNNRTVIVRGIKAGVTCDGLTAQGITPNGATVSPRLVSVTVQDNDTIQVRYVGGSYQFSFFQKLGTDNYKSVKTVTNPPSGIITQKLAVKDANKEQYCFKIGMTDVCQRASYSDSTCSIPFQVTPSNKKNFLKWKSLPSRAFASYRIIRNTAANFKTITSAIVDTLTDRPTVCGTNYTYQIIGLSGQGGSVQSISRQITVIGIDSTKPPSITNVLVTVEKEKVKITATLPAGQQLKSYIFYRWKNNKLDAFNSGGNGTIVVDDKSIPTQQQECYKVAYENRCSILSDTSAAFCPSFLTLESDGIKWTEYQKFPLGLSSYYVEKLDENGAILSTSKVDKSLLFKPDPSSIDPSNPVVKYRIRASSINGLNSFSNEVYYSQKLLMFLPDAFTPNGDGKNDLFVINAIFVKTFSLKIFSKNGNIIFQTTNYKDYWDGTRNGAPLPQDTYYYSIVATDFKEETTKKNGNIFLLR